MSTTAKTITWTIVAVVVVGGGIWWYISMAPTVTAPTNTNPTSPTSMANPTSTPGTTAAPATAPSNDISSTNTSNAQLQADLSQTDNKMNGFSSDNTNISSGMNDQPVQQSQF